VKDIRKLMTEWLTKGHFRIDDVARDLGMSSKTLERRLADKDETFTELLGAIRRDLARHYVRETDFRLDQIAYLTGYSEPAALVRAFKRWTGTTPMQYRAAQDHS
jgi:AraC-like DNA-binding protein